MRFVVCLSNEGYPAALERHKIYQSIPDPDAASQSLIRILDESGEDYLYPQSWFLRLTLTKAVRQALQDAS